MSRILDPKQKLRQMRILAVCCLIFMIVLWYPVNSDNPSMSSFVLFASGGLVLAGLALGSAEIDRRRSDELAEEAAAHGFIALHGPLTSGFTGWPAGSLPIFEKYGWTFTSAHRNADDSMRIFNAQRYLNEEQMDYMSGAVIRVPGAKFPFFSIQRAQSGWLDSTPPSAAVFSFDPTFTTEFAVATANTRALDERLGAHFVTTWRAHRQWKLEGKGDCVVIWREEAMRSFHFAWVAGQLSALADVIRQDVGAS